MNNEKKMEKLTKNKIKTLRKEVRNKSSYKDLVEFIEVISNKDRFLILNLLKENSCLLSDIEKNLDKSQASIAHHLRILEKHKLITSSKNGKFKQYSILKETFAKFLNIWDEWFNVIRSRDY